MCGVFGLSLKDTANPDPTKLTVLATLLAIKNDIRGGDSWGFIAPNANTPGHLLRKGVGKLQDARDIQFLGELALNKRVLMVHTRAGRMGGVSKETAHPFTVGDIVGAHNGVIYNWDDMKKKYSEYKDFKVDSNVLIGHIANDRPTNELRGWGVVEYVNTRLAPRSVFIGKLTDTGSLAMADVRDIGLVWSSDKDHLEFALKVAGFTKWRPYEFKHGLLYEIVNGGLFRTTKSIAIESYKPSNNTGPHGYEYGGSYNSHGVLASDEHWCQEPHCWNKVKNGTPKCQEHTPKQLPAPTGTMHVEVTDKVWSATDRKPTEVNRHSDWNEIDSYVAAAVESSQLSATQKRALRTLEDLEGAESGSLPFCEG